MTNNTYTRRFNEHGVEFIDINNSHASASICLQGAHICQYKPHAGDELLWLSDEAVFQPNTSIRGGIPICWPWFGIHPNEDYPAHGLVRSVVWQVKTISESDAGTEVVLAISPDDIDHAKFPFAFELTLSVLIGESLELALTTKNTDTSAFVLGEAFHTYFPVSDIADVKVAGLEGENRINTLTTPFSREQQQSALLTVEAETDFVYVDCAGDLVLTDASNKITIERTGSQSMVVWNPWIDKSKRLSHFNDDDYHKMMCLESANAFDNTIELSSGETHTMTTKITGASL